jgi:formylglycine-generating enzyme required for sulfatase activity
MGCTMVAAILESGKVWWDSVGDSHLYLIRNKVREKINADHSYGGFLDRMAAMGTPVEPEPGLARNMLMSAVTGDEINEIDVSQEPLELQHGDRIMLCSDGMDTLSEGKFIQFSDWSDNPKECAEALLTAVEDAAMPKQDNTTIVVVDVKEKASAEAPAPAPAAAEAAPAPAPEPAQAAPQPAAATWQPPVVEQEKKGGKGLIIGIAAVVIIGVAVGGFVMMGGQQTSSPPVSSTPAIDTMDTETPVAEEETVSPVEEEVEVADTPVEPEVTAPPPVASTTTAATGRAAGAEFSDRLADGSSGPAMVVIPAGSFDMGSSGSSSASDERPRHNVRVNKFAISKYEITFEDYEKFARAAGRKIPDNLYMDKATHPVIFVTWDDAFYYTRWLSEQTGEQYSLPSESQWEYAAGTGARSSFFWGFEEEPNRAHCFGCGTGLDPRKPTRVGSFQSNKFGIYDTAGNVAEWVHDCWHDNYNGAPASAEVWEGGECAVRVVRGGSYSSPPQSIRHAKRDKFKSDSSYDNIGIRVVRAVQ